MWLYVLPVRGMYGTVIYMLLATTLIPSKWTGVLGHLHHQSILNTNNTLLLHSLLCSAALSLGSLV